ncbi:MAG: O-antigen ligase family protein [Bacillus sp. (in: Bacteria)]|nr:O-antigen ligase family protein [Bacillus sp. (in: firmicutes)]
MSVLGTIFFLVALIVLSVPIPYGSLVARGLMGIGVFVGLGQLFFSEVGLRRTDIQFIFILGIYLAGSLISSLLAVNQDKVFIDFIRQTFIIFSLISLMILLKSAKARKLFIYGNIIISLAIASIIIICFIILVEPLKASLSEMRNFKFLLANSYNIHLNPLSFAMVLSFVLALPALLYSKLLVIGFSIIIVSALLLSGSRTSIFVFFLTPLLVLLTLKLKQLKWPLRWILMFFTILVTILVYMWMDTYFFYILDYNYFLHTFSQVSTGRVDLWIGAFCKFMERPLAGWGTGSWDIDLFYYLPYYYDYTKESILNLQSGAFHSAYLTLLAEKGLLGFMPGLMILLFIIQKCFFIHKYSLHFLGMDKHISLVLPYWITLIVLRGFCEQGGLIGYANAQVDFISFWGTALIVTLYSYLPRGKIYEKNY